MGCLALLKVLLSVLALVVSSGYEAGNASKGIGVDDVLIAINTSLLGARGLEHQDGVPGKSGVLKSA